jgi:hypothetical protein
MFALLYLHHYLLWCDANATLGIFYFGKINIKIAEKIMKNEYYDINIGKIDQLDQKLSKKQGCQVLPCAWQTFFKHCYLQFLHLHIHLCFAYR